MDLSMLFDFTGLGGRRKLMRPECKDFIQLLRQRGFRLNDIWQVFYESGYELSHSSIRNAYGGDEQSEGPTQAPDFDTQKVASEALKLVLKDLRQSGKHPIGAAFNANVERNSRVGKTIPPPRKPTRTKDKHKL